MESDRSRSQKRRLLERVLAVLLVVGACGVLAGSIWLLAPDGKGRSSAADADRSANDMPPSVAPQLYKPISAEDALAENAAIPLSTAPIERAPPLILPISQAAAVGRRSAIDCLTAAIYYEAGNESARGKRGVAQVILNRARHPAFPNTICGVVYQGSERKTGCQFTFTCDGSLARRPSRAGWEAARMVAIGALSGGVEPEVGMATHYHADYVVPYWARSLSKTVQIDHHIFYRWQGGWGRRAAFTQSVSQEQPLEDQSQVEALPDISMDQADLNSRSEASVAGPRLLADEKVGTLSDLVGSPAVGRESGIKADEKLAKPAADQAAGALKGE